MATYADGVLHSPAKTAALLAEAGTTHWFQVGEPVVLSNFEVNQKSDSITVTVDTLDHTSRARVRFPFHHGYLSSAQAAQVQEVIGQVLAIDDRAAPPPVAAPSAPVNGPSQQLPAPTAPGAPYELFVRSAPGVVNPMRAQTQFLVLFPDGTAMGSLPDNGMDGFNPQAYFQWMAQRGPVNNLFGRYQINGPRVDILWGNFSQSFVLGNDGGTGGAVSGQVLQPLCRCDGARFSGIYAWGQFALQFSADGTFLDRGAIDVVAAADPGHPKLGQGSYGIQANTLYLNYTDGRRFRTSFAAPAALDAGPTFAWIAIKQKIAYLQGR